MCSPVLYDLQRSKQGQKLARFISATVLLCHSLIAAWKSSFANHDHHIKVASFFSCLSLIKVSGLHLSTVEISVG